MVINRQKTPVLGQELTMTELHRSEVHRNLDAKFKIGNLEALDILAALIFGAVMNLFFGGTFLEIPIVIGGPVLIIAILYFGKRGKPERFMVHLMRFYLQPGFFQSNEEPKEIYQLRRKIYE